MLGQPIRVAQATLSSNSTRLTLLAKPSRNLPMVSGWNRWLTKLQERRRAAKDDHRYGE